MILSVVVTGASGFIGSALAEWLKKQPDIEVVAVSRTTIDTTHICVEDYGDTPKGNILIHAAEDPDRVRVNLAGESYYKKSVTVLNELLSKGFDKVIYCSSATVYGDTGCQPYAEESPVKSVDNYVRVKLENERRVIAVGGIVVRFSNVIGPGMSPSNVISDILKQLTGSGSIAVRDDSPVRDFVWLDDVIDGLHILITQGMAGIYNIGSGRGTSVRELAQMAIDMSGQQSRKIKSLVVSPNSSYNVLDIGKMKQMYGWSPKTSMYQCIEQLITHK